MFRASTPSRRDRLRRLGLAFLICPMAHSLRSSKDAPGANARENARAFESAGAAIVMLDSECTGEKLLEELRALLGDTQRLQRMGDSARSLAKPVAVETIVEAIFSVSFEEAS